LSEKWLNSVLFGNSYIVLCYFIHQDKSSIFTPVLKTVPVQVKRCNMSPTLDVFRCLLVTKVATLRLTILSRSISSLLQWSQAEQYYSSDVPTRDSLACSFTGVELMLGLRRRKPSVLSAFV